MKCPRCQVQNRDGLKFCEDCGARLTLTCQRCEAEVSPGKKFCGSCGAPVTVQAADRFASPEAYTPKHLAEKILTSKGALEGERKQVTVMFADLKGSMELLADRDPEEARKLLDPVLEHMMEAVHRYEGTVNQVMGDGIMALFGAPLAHEDHAVRACYAALTMQESVKQYAERVQRTEGIPIQIRIGMNSGEVVVRSIGGDLRMDYTAVGQTTHLAARMEQMAMPGSILVTGDTLRLAEGYVQIKSLGPVNVKGLSAPVEVCEVTGAGPVRSRLKAAAERGLTRFVGRDTELATIRQALDKAGNGQGQVVALVGEPGVGKSRLFWEFTHSRRTVDWLIVEGGSVSYGKATAYLPIKDLLKEYFSIEGRDDARKIREKVTGKLLTLDESLKPTLPAFLMLLDISVEDQQWQNLDPPQRRQRILEAIKRLLLRESQVQPLLLVVEDLHWIDSETQSFLESFIDSIPTAQILLLVNYRPEYQHGWGSKTYYSQLRLDPLPPESAGELLEAMLGNDPALQSLQQLLIERTEGNPFFLEESVRTLVERKVLVGERRNYRLSGPIENIQVPATVQAVLAARIDRLQPEEKRLLQSAAVIGKDVPFVLLQAIADQSDEELRRNLNRLQAGEFLYETSLFPDLEYTFKHALTQEVAYNSVLMERRRVLHERTAQAIEGLYQARLEEHYGHLAYHYSRSGTTQKAVEYLKLAGQQAVQRSANAEAISYFTNALELLKTLPTSPERVQQELTLQIAMGVPLVATKGHGVPEVEKAYTRARELCQQVGETPQLFPALVGLYRFYLLRSEMRTSRELAEQIMSLARKTQDPALLLQAHRALGETLLYSGEIAESQTHLEQAIVLYNPQKHHSHAFLYGVDPGVYALTHSAYGLWLLGYSDQSLKRMQKSITLARGLSHPFSLAFALGLGSWIHQYRREIPAAQELTEALMPLANEQGFPVWWAWGTIVRGWAMAEQEQIAEGITQMRQGLAALRTRGVESFRPFILTLLAEACRKTGQIEEGLKTLAEAFDTLDKTGERYYEAELYRIKGELLLAREGKTAKGKKEAVSEAETCFSKAIDIARSQSAKSLELRAVRSLSRLWQKQGKKDEARRMLAEIYGWFTEGFDTADLKEAKALLEELS